MRGPLPLAQNAPLKLLDASVEKVVLANIGADESGSATSDSPVDPSSKARWASAYNVGHWRIPGSNR